MKIYSVNLYSQNFTGKRQDRKTLEQLKQNNPYDLNVINQRNINTAIDSLSQVPGKDNVNFLLDVSKNLKYGTNIDLGKTPYNDWQVKINTAAKKAIDISPEKERPQLYAKLDKLNSKKKPLTASELKILDLRKSILSKVNREALSEIKNENIKNFDNNFDYLITSSEIPIAHKVYILKKLDYLMSPKYKINEQLADKKTQVLAEIVNDLVINTPESKIPNTKAVNQLQHGMCAAISICRKALAYEDKPNFVDIILSELDNKPHMMVYDISKLGTKSKIPIDKPYINYEYAMQKGYRIIDTSALNWMSIADTTGSTYEASADYVSFDKEYFDTFSDLHLFKDINDEMAPEQDFYRALLRSQEILEECKKADVLKDYKNGIRKSGQIENLTIIQKYIPLLFKDIEKVAPSSSKEQKRQIFRELLSLEAKSSYAIDKSGNKLKEFMYIENEPESIKLSKIKNYITSVFPEANTENLNELAPDILDLIKNINSRNPQKTTSYAAKTINRAKQLYAAAAAYRVQYDFGLENKNRIKEMSKVLNIPDQETLIIQNIDNLIDKINKGTINPQVKKALTERFVVSQEAVPDEILVSVLQMNKKAFLHGISETLDMLHSACLHKNRKFVLLNNLTAARNSVNENDKEVLKAIAQELDISADKRKVLKILDEYIEILNNENCTQEQYIEIYNKLGGKNQLEDFKTLLGTLGKILFNNAEDYPQVVQGFNLSNGLDENAAFEQTLEAFQKIADIYNNLAGITATLQSILEVKTPDGEILNTVKPKDIIMAKLENANEIISAKDLKMFQDKFTEIDKARLNTDDGSAIFLKDLPQELTKLTPHEKEVLKVIERNINKWYAATTRNFITQHKEYKKEFEELSREIGVKTGAHWVKDGKSGLTPRAQIKIFEHMTDRPYYTENDSYTALEKIKKSPYSGISGMSMQSDRPAMHAQYIVDLKPVNITTPNGIFRKEALFHDNTWGSIEHENVWIDENGLIRTDYFSGSGGKLGFITDENYRSGKFLENLLDDVGEYTPDNINSKLYKKLNRGDDESYKFKIFRSIVTPGAYPNIRTTITNIKNNTTIPPDQYLKDLIDYAQNMTRDEIQQRIKNIELCGSNIEKVYEKFEDRIWGKMPLTKGIETQKDYDELAEDDELKLLLEKSAVLMSYYEIPELSKIYTEKPTPQNIQKLKNIIRKEARKNFDYSFGKDINIVTGAINNSVNEIHTLLTEYQIQTRVKISDKNIKQILNSMKNIDKTKFDGSIDTTINLMIENFKNSMQAKTLNCENKKQKINDTAEKVRAVLIKNMYFNKEDMKSAEFRRDNLPAIEKWIDDNFNPADDDEFVSIYNKLQKMTTDEFREKYNYLINDEALGIKPLTGYDMLKKFRALDDSISNIIYNLLYYNELYTITEQSKTTPTYDYTKLSRVSKGGIYTDGKRSFDDIYIDYYYSLRSLTMEKLYGKHKDSAFRKYGVSPAYAKVEIEDKEAFNDEIINLYRNISESIDYISTIKLMLSSIADMKKLQKYINRIDDNAVLKDSQKEYILKILSKFHNDYITDSSIEQEVKLADEIIIKLVGNNSSFKECKTKINTLAQNIIQYEKTQSGVHLSESIKSEVADIKKEKFSYILQVVDQKHHKKAFELLNKWISAKAKNTPDADIYYAEFEEYINRHKIINSPDKMLKDYLLLLAKPSDSNNPHKGMTDGQKKELESIKNIYEENIASLLYSANLVEIQNLLMKCAQDGYLNMIKDELKNTKLKLQNGLVTDLYSDSGLLLILENMFTEKDLDTALLFIEQLGIGERVVELYAKNTNFDNAKKCVKRIHSIFDAVDKQVRFINQEISKLSDIDTDPNYKQRLEQAKANINKFCMNTNFRTTAKNADKVMTAIIEELDKNPNQPKYKLITENITYLKLKNTEYAKNYVEHLNNVLRQIQDIQALMKNIKLPNKSEAQQARQEFFDKIADLQNYTVKYSRNYPNINITAGGQ